MVEVLEEDQEEKLYIIMEYMQKGSLDRKIEKGPMPLLTVWQHFRDLISGLEYCHEVAGIIHRDIKPENMLISQDDVLKISDFGVSTIMENGRDLVTTTAGSNYFFSLIYIVCYF